MRGYGHGFGLGATLLAVALTAGLGAPPATADTDDASLRALLDGADVVVDATLRALDGPIYGEIGVAHYAAELEVHAYVKGSLPLPPPAARRPNEPVLPRASIVRFELEEEDPLPYLRAGARVVLFLKQQPAGNFPVHQTSDMWLGVQPYGPWLVRRLTTLVGEVPPTRPVLHLEGVLYEVFHGDTIHRMGFHVREIHVPSRELGFYVAGGTLRVFRPEPMRYRIPGEVVTLPGIGVDGEPLRVPILSTPGCDTRRLRTLRLRASDVQILEDLLAETTKRRTLAEGYLNETADAPPEAVAGYRWLNQEAQAFIAGVLEAAGLEWWGTSGAGGDVLSVAGDRAEEARRVLLRALHAGLARAPTEDDAETPWGPQFDFVVIGTHGDIVWRVDRTQMPPVPVATDVLAHVARFPGSEVVTDGSGAARRPRYGDHTLEEAEDALRDELPRPWTVPVLLTAYAEASAEDRTVEGDVVRAALITLLAACRNDDALAVVGPALSDDSLDVRVNATYGLLTYWVPDGVPCGGTEQAMDRAAKWWAARTR